MKKTMKKYFVALTLALTFACSMAAVAGCKKGDDKPSSTESSSSIESSVEQTKTYLITFETNGGTPVAAAQVEEGTTISLKDFVTTKDGAYFYGWALDKDFQNRASATMTITENTKFYAQWGAEEKYTLSFVTNGGTEIQSVLYRPNDYLAEPVAPTKPFHTFAGWYTDAACTQEISFYTFPQMPKGDLTVYAKWIPANGIIFESNGGTEVEMVTGAMGDPVFVEEPTKAGYIFEGWYADKACTQAYDVAMIPNGLVTVYAKWHEQQKNISITLHVNYGGMETTATIKGNEGEAISADEALAAFTTAVNDSVKDAYVGNADDLKNKPIFKFSAWAFDAKGSQRFDGELPQAKDGKLDLYAVWIRTAAYCEISFVENDVTTSYYIQKNTVLSDDIFEQHTAQAKAEYEAKGCAVDGFYTAGGNRYEKGMSIAMDMRLIPYVYTPDLSYSYVNVPTGTGATLKGYSLDGYATDSYKDKDELLVLVPDFYNDGVNGQLPIVWIGDNAFKDHNVSEITIPSSVMGIGKNAFMNTALTSVSLPEKLYYIGDDAFTDSENLATVTFNSEVSQFGATIFKNTVYEGNMPSDEDGFIFFEVAGLNIYGYKGTKASIVTPSTARNIAGGAFKDNATIKEVVLNSGIRYVGDYAFEGSAIESVVLGKFFSSMGKGIFKDCTALTSVSFASQYNLAQIGVSMFEGCTALQTIDLAQIASLKTVEAKAFYGCTALQSIVFSDTFLELKESAFENCTSLVCAELGQTEDAEFTQIGNRVFAGCTNLASVVIPGNLRDSYVNGTKTVVFGTQVFDNANPVVYVKDKYVDNWGNSEEFADQSTYVEIYRNYLNGKGYKTIEVKAIDHAPSVSVNGTAVLSASSAISGADIVAAILAQGAITVSDETEQANCRFYIQSVILLTQQEKEVLPVNGTYALTAGSYAITLTVEDECCNKASATVNVIVNA